MYLSQWYIQSTRPLKMGLWILGIHCETIFGQNFYHGSQMSFYSNWRSLIAFQAFAFISIPPLYLTDFKRPGFSLSIGHSYCNNWPQICSGEESEDDFLYIIVVSLQGSLSRGAGLPTSCYTLGLWTHLDLQTGRWIVPFLPMWC